MSKNTPGHQRFIYAYYLRKFAGDKNRNFEPCTISKKLDDMGNEKAMTEAFIVYLISELSSLVFVDEQPAKVRESFRKEFN